MVDTSYDGEFDLITAMAMTMAADYRLEIDQAHWRELYPDREPVAGFAVLEDFCRRVAFRFGGWSDDRFDTEVADHVEEGLAIQFTINDEKMLIVTAPLREPIKDRRVAKKSFRSFVQNGQRELAKLSR